MRMICCSQGSVLVISGRAKDRTGEKHASVFSPTRITPEIQEQNRLLAQRKLTRFVARGWTSLKLPSLAPTIRAFV